MVSNMKVDILWSPRHKDTFLTLSSDLQLNQVNPAYRHGGHHPYSSIVSVNSDIQYIKCVTWFPGEDPAHLVAVGQTTGKVILTNFGKNGSKDPLALEGKEFTPPHRRQCNALVWAPLEKNMLAEGLDKSRTDHPILVWDVTAKAMPDATVTPDKQRHHASDSVVSRPLIELGPHAESCFSLCWFKNQPKLLATGMNKYIRIYDLREKVTHKEQMVTQTKAVFGLCFDPFNTERMASFFEGQLLLWDLRSFEKPTLSFSETKHLVKLDWCPTRNGLLGSLTKDSSVVNLHDVQHVGTGNEDVDPIIAERLVHACGEERVISSFTWHPQHENEMVSVTATGNITSVHVLERISLSWSPTCDLTWSRGRHMQSGSEQTTEEYISTQMRHRAIKGYGLCSERVFRNAEFIANAGNKVEIEALWRWIDLIDSLLEEGRFRGVTTKPASRYIGVRIVLRGDLHGKGPLSSDFEYTQWDGLHKARQYPWTPLVYKNEDRSKALLLCDWGFDKDDLKFDRFLARLLKDGQVERAAAICLFSLQFRRCLSILNQASMKDSSQGGSNLGIIATALSGFSGEYKNPLWQEMCSKLLPQIDHPCIRAMFSFLTSGDGNGRSYEAVLSEKGLLVQDRVAFACKFLSDSKLSEYMESITKEMKERGDLQGLLLTGLTSDGVDLLQRYIERTGDIQTAVLAIVHSLPGDISKNERANNWIEDYRVLLDGWSLWHHRAEFDIFRHGRDNSPKPPQQIYVSCNFCGKSVSSRVYNTRMPQHFIYQGGPTANKSKMTSCPGCRKPLPRCSVCLINMGTAAASLKQKTKLESHHDKELAPFCNWFTWCQTCRHGGHAEHITHWFQTHQECPVNSCNCKCMSIDGMSRLLTQEHR